MGHQVNYYMTPKDIEALEQKFRNRIDFAVIPWRNPSQRPQPTNSLLVEHNGQRVLSLCLVRPQDLSQVVTDYVDTQQYWTVEEAPSPVLEFRACFFDGTTLGRGRVYYVDGFYDSTDQWVTKSEDFRKWARSIFSIVKKSLKPLEPGSRSTWYIGEDAAQWHAAGGTLKDM
jgi:hypothetical protein